MSNTSIQLKKSGITGNTPADLNLGEVAINYADGKLYYKDSIDDIKYINNQDSFATINVNSTLVLAASPTDTLSLTTSNDITVLANTTSKTIIIGSNSVAGSYANAAFIQANAAFDLANTISGGSVDVTARDIANSAFIQANAAFAYANTMSPQDNVARDTANSAALYANGAFVQANAAFITANTPSDVANSAALYANGAFLAANTPSNVANSAALYANAAFIQANAVFQYANTLSPQDNVARDTANSASLYANSAFDQANGAFLQANTPTHVANSAALYANGAFIQSNSAYDKANSANVLAQDAYNDSNTRVSNTGDTMTGDLQMTANILPTAANTYYLGSETMPWHSVYVGPGSINIDGVVLGNTGGSLTVTSSTSTLDLTYISNTSNSAALYANGAFVQSNAAFEQANSAASYANSAFLQANAAFIVANTPDAIANSSALYANGAFLQANAAYTRANNSVNANSGGTITGDITINANLIVSGANVALGDVGNVHIYGGNTGQLLTTDGTGNISFIDLPSPNTVTYTANSLIQTNGVYVSGNLWSTQIFGDYALANGAYVLTDGTGSAPAWYIDFDFINVVKFNRVVMNINYTQASGHTIYVQLYNNNTSAWDSIGTYTGLGSYYAFALDVIDETAYVNGSSIVQLRLYHSNQGNAAHQTSIDYIALEQSIQGPQGPRGPTGPTGTTGATGNGVASGGSTGQILVKNSSTNYDTSWSNTINGSLAITQDLSVTGNLTVLGTSTSINTSSFTVNDTLLILGLGNYTSDILDIGFASHYNDGQNAHTGIFRDASEKQWMFFEGYTPEVSPNNDIIITDPSFKYANVRARDITGNLIANNVTINGYNVFSYITNAYTQANTPSYTANSAALYANGAFIQANGAFLQANTPSYTANSASLYANGAFSAANTADSKAVTSGSYANSAFLVANTPTHVANSASLYANGAFIQANAAFITANTPTHVANSAATYANGAFTAANTADSKAVSAGSYANSAFLVANTPPAIANSAALYANGAFTAANTADSKAVTAGSYANAAFLVANTPPAIANSAALYANGAFLQANAAFLVANTPPAIANSAALYANGAFLAANTADSKAVSAGSYANSAFLVANTPPAIANSAALYANGAFIQANAAFIRANTPDAIANSGAAYANAAFIQANAAFITANTPDAIANSAALYANGAFIQANAAFITANTPDAIANSAALYANGAFIQANAAFAAANSSTNNPVILAVDTFTSTGTTTITLTATPATEYSTIVYINGVYQHKDQYSLSGNIITFSSAPTVGDAIEVTTYTTNTTNMYFATNQYVSSFGGQIGAITLSSANVTTALGYTPATTTDQTASSSYANSAFLKANAAFITANTPDAIANSAALYANGAFLQANAAFITANTPDAIANSAALYANGAFTAANTADSKAISAGSYANAAFLVANTPTHVANSAALYANGAFLQANAAFTKANNALANTTGTFNGSLSVTGTLTSLQSSGDEGGQIDLLKAATNTTLVTGVSIDVFQNRVRIFETGGTNRGVYLDLANNAGTTVGTDLLSFTSAASYANAAFLKANAAFITANTPDAIANSAALYANGAFVQANAAFTKANSTVSSVGFTGGIITVATATTTPAFTVAGTSGGIPYFSSGTTWASSAALAASALVVGGGAGVAPATTTTGTGVVTALGVNTGTAGAFVVNGGVLGTPSSGTLTNCTFPTLNQSTTGSAASVVATVTGTNSTELVRGNMADNDQFRILVGGTATNAGFVELATADDGTEPIYVRQYTGVFTTVARTATLLDGSGNTTFPGSVTGTSFSGAGTGLTGTAASLSIGGSAASSTTATNATNIGITDDVATSSAVYPTWVTATTGNLPAKTSSTKLTFVPSTGTLSSTVMTATSDINLKDNVVTISNAVDTVKKLRGVEYDWKDNGNHSMGVVAQELEKVLPYLVDENENGKSVMYSNMIGLLIEAVKEQQIQIDELKNMINKST